MPIVPTERSGITLAGEALFLAPSVFRLVHATAGGDRFLSVAELSHINPHAVQDDSELVGDCNPGAACAEFSWQGNDDADEACGRNWVTIATAGRVVGHIFIHQADDSGFVCERD